MGSRFTSLSSELCTSIGLRFNLTATTGSCLDAKKPLEMAVLGHPEAVESALLLPNGGNGSTKGVELDVSCHG
jgi:hypothetical protein